MKPKYVYPNLDAEESIFFENELNAVKAGFVETDFPALKARTLIPVLQTADPADKTFEWREITKVGAAKVVADFANDFLRIDLVGKRNTGKIESLGDSFGYTVADIRAARKTGRPLDSMLAKAAKEILAIKEEEIAWEGEAEYNLPGFLGNASIPEVTGITGDWATASAADILADMVALDSAPYINTLEIERPTTFLLPLAQYRLVTTTLMPDTNGLTIAEFFLKSSFCKEIVPLNRLAGYGAEASDRAMVYTRDPMKVWLEIPMEAEIGDPVAKGRAFEIPVESRIGGVAWVKPWSAAFMDGI